VQSPPIYSEPFRFDINENGGDPLIQKARLERADWRRFEKPVHRSVYPLWVVPQSRQEWIELKGFSILLLDQYVHQLTDLLEEVLFLPGGQTGGAPSAQDPGMPKPQPLHFLPDLIPFQPVFQSVQEDQSSQVFGPLRQRRMLFVPSVFLAQTGQFILRSRSGLHTLPFARSPVLTRKVQTYLTQPWKGSAQVPDSKAVASALRRAGFGGR
jgi:hypothetical protein